MRVAPIAFLLCLLAGCGRFYDHSRIDHSEVGSFGRQIVQMVLLYENEHGKNDADHLITLDDLVAAQPSYFDAKVMAAIESAQVVFLPQKIPIAAGSIVVIIRDDDEMMTVDSYGLVRVFAE